MPSTGFITFELDLMEAVLNQLVPRLDAMDGAPMTRLDTSQLPDAQGVYLLVYQGKVHYVGKTDADAGLRTRLTRHVAKLEHRKNISPTDVRFKAAQIFVLTAMNIESRLIRHYEPEWNGSGFGSNDPGRERETTAKAPNGFDTQFPIDIDLPLEILKPGPTTAHNALVTLKEALPYTLRFELEPAARGSQAYRTRPHPDLSSTYLTIPQEPMTVRDAMRLIVRSLPAGWQATYFVSHVILYKENRDYAFGTRI